ncbi:ABC transporter ATP-binding protein [Deferribacteraceae bacterium V6Fe1]|nr:ABC transporter ATP-binding protein [Deferribacteraceae bacterium V6Fe1]
MIKVRNLNKYYHADSKIIKALDNVNIEIPSNKIFTLLGPSGCGKTTLLRSLVGLETPDSGEIEIDGQIVFSSEKHIYIPTEKRGLGMVFQTYAIWPHMTIYENIAYPLENLKLPKDEIKSRVKDILKLVQLDGFENRPATKISGGQQQRVALARALVAKPKVILFDEPLSNLDAKLREDTRKELKVFLSELGITAVYVTHDRIEALALSDTIAVMRSGKIVETGTPKKIYFHSETSFVADFIGKVNIFKGEVAGEDGKHTILKTELGTIKGIANRKYSKGEQALFFIRPEFINISKEPASNINTIKGILKNLVFVGESYEADFVTGAHTFSVTINPDDNFVENEEAFITFDPKYTVIIND